MKVKVQKIDGKAARATSSSTMPCSVSSRAPTSCTASSPGSSKTAAAPPARRVSVRMSPAPARSSAARRAAARARHGDRAAPIFIGGGKAHGARKRDFEQSLNKKIRALGLKMALSSKAKDGLVDRRQPRAEGRQDQGAQGPPRQGRLERQGAGDRRRSGERRLHARPRATCRASTCCRPWAPTSTTS